MENPGRAPGVCSCADKGVALAGLFVVDDGWPDYIGNDWQSSKGARPGLLDHIRHEQEE